MAIVKLLSDFDGVWTNQDTEAEYVRNYIIKRISEITPLKENEIRDLFDECKKDMDKTPYEYGWRYDGHKACYYQEDPFGDNNAVFDYIEKYSSGASYSNYKQKLAVIKDSVVKKTKNKTLSDFSNECFTRSTTQFKLEGKLKPAPKSETIVKELNRKGIEIIVASNSKTEKIEHLFRKAGHKVTNEKSIVRGRLHAIGNAQKFVIDKSFTDIPERLEINKRYHPELRRKYYYKILLQETPDYVLGDVFSLDLALPLYLRLNDNRFKKLKVILLLHKHTPKWIRDYLAKDEFANIAFTIDSIEKLPDLVAASKHHN